MRQARKPKDVARFNSMARFQCVTALGVLCAATSARAQAPAVVQLPSFSSFSVDTSVSAPDRGSVSLGGVGRSSTGSTAFGPGIGPGNRSFGRSTSSSNTSVRATIHDLDALDRATLDRANANRTANKPSGGTDHARRLAAARQSSAGQVPAGSVADARRQRAAEVVSEQAETNANLKRAREAAAAGKTSVAAMFYKLAAKHASGDLKSQVEKEAAALARSAKTPRVAHTTAKPH
jgi:hypothetical protein